MNLLKLIFNNTHVGQINVIDETFEVCFIMSMLQLTIKVNVLTYESYKGFCFQA